MCKYSLCRYAGAQKCTICTSTHTDTCIHIYIYINIESEPSLDLPIWTRIRSDIIGKCNERVLYEMVWKKLGIGTEYDENPENYVSVPQAGDTGVQMQPSQ